MTTNRLDDFDARLDYLFCDIDDTLTDEGKLTSIAFSALWNLADAGVRIVPVTGRPAGWCELIARQWPVDGVIGENGAFYFRYLPTSRHMKRHFLQQESVRMANQQKLHQLGQNVLRQFPGTALASDQFCRLFDIAIDFCEDVPPLSLATAAEIKKLCESAGAEAKVSSIHVNAWYGNYSKVTAAKLYCADECNLSDSAAKKTCGFVGDSPNDEPMWQEFPNSFAVANVSKFLQQLEHQPKWISPSSGGRGFAEIAAKILAARS